MTIPGNPNPPSQPDSVTDIPAAGQGGPLAQFTLDFAKAMLRTGYYAADHPEAQQSRAGLYEEFRRVLGDRSGLTYLVGTDGDRRTVMVDGYDQGPMTLDAFMIHGMAELFAPKLLDFFERRHLLSFSLRAGITAGEFDAFLLLMSEPPTAGRAEDERDRVTRALVDRHVIHVSTLFEADVVGRERRLPWRVELALSRLGRDLRTLPLYEHASPEKIQETKIQIIDDVIRPLRTPQLLMDLLVHCDLLARDIAVLGEAQIEHEIIAQVPARLLTETTQLLLDALRQGRAAGDDGREVTSRYRLVIRDILNELVRADVDIDGELLETIVSQEILAVDQFPRSLQRKLQRLQLVRRFLADRDSFLAGFGHFKGGKYGSQLAIAARIIVPGLLRQGNFHDAAAILDALESGEHEADTVDAVNELKGLLRRSLATEETVPLLVEALGDEDLDKANRDALVELLAFSGERAGSGLLDVYATTASVPIRACALEAMMRIGPPALVPFLKRLSQIEPEWPAVHHVLGALAGQTDPGLADPIKLFLRHENAHVRQAALTRLFEILGPSAENLLVAALADPDAATRQSAVVHLGSLNSRHPAVLAFYAEALRADGSSAGQEPDEVLVEVCRSLTGVADASFRDGSGAEEVLLGALQQQRRKKRITGMFQKRQPRHSERVRAAIYEALGNVGTRDTTETLRDLASSEAEDVARAANEAAEQIQRRSPT